MRPRLNTTIVNIFLDIFSRTIPEDEHAVMIWDGAGFHASKSLCVPENITLVQLPPYSPELNPNENLWQYLKSHFLEQPRLRRIRSPGKSSNGRLAVLDENLVKSVWTALCIKRATSD